MCNGDTISSTHNYIVAISLPWDCWADWELAHQLTHPLPPTGPSTSSITLLLSLPSLDRWDLIWLYYGDHLGDCAINQREDGRCGQLPVNQPRGRWSFDGDREGEEERDSIKWTKKAAPLSLAGLVEEKHFKSQLPLFPGRTSEMKSTFRGKCTIIEGGGAWLMPLRLLFSATFFFSQDACLFSFSIF